MKQDCIDQIVSINRSRHYLQNFFIKQNFLQNYITKIFKIPHLSAPSLQQYTFLFPSGSQCKSATTACYPGSPECQCCHICRCIFLPQQWRLRLSNLGTPHSELLPGKLEKYNEIRLKFHGRSNFSHLYQCLEISLKTRKYLYNLFDDISTSRCPKYNTAQKYECNEHRFFTSISQNLDLRHS